MSARRWPRAVRTQWRHAMLTEEQLHYFNTYGFVILRNVFSQDEMRTIQSEFDHRAAVASGYERFDGSKRHNIRMMGEDTPFFASLLEDSRFVDAAEQMFGKVLPVGVDADRYVDDSAWHYDAGGWDAYGVKFAFYLQSVRAYSGSLRVIPGAHKREWFDELYHQEPIGPRWTRNAASPEEMKLAMDAIDSIPGYACESNPGDVVAFDLRMYHASYGGSRDRHMCSVVYYVDPSTPEQSALMRMNAIGLVNPTEGDPWNPTSIREEWLANREGSLKRQAWIDRLREVAEMPEGRDGLKVVAENGKMKLVPA